MRLLSLIAMVFLLYSFGSSSFTKTQFLLPSYSGSEKAYQVISHPCSIITSSNSLIKTLCTTENEQYLVNFSNALINNFFGSFLHNEIETDWNTCTQKSPTQEGFIQCFSSWTAHQAQIPVGSLSLPTIMRRTLENDIFIGSLLVTFVILFPLLYAIILVHFVFKPDIKSYSNLKIISSWSMLDVLILSLFITSIKGPSISIYITIGNAGYSFICSIVLFKIVEYYTTKKFLQR